MKMSWIFFTRTDLPKSWILVQTAHASYLAGEKFGHSKDLHFVVLGVKNLDELHRVKVRLEFDGIEFVAFEESYKDTGLTSIATRPLPFRPRWLREYSLLSMD